MLDVRACVPAILVCFVKVWFVRKGMALRSWRRGPRWTHTCEYGSEKEEGRIEDPEMQERNTVDDWPIFYLKLGRKFCIVKEQFLGAKS